MTSSLVDSLQLIVVAMGTVFAALYALSLLMSALPNFVGREKPATPKQQPVSEATELVPAPEPVELDTHVLPEHTVAVIASAIAAYLGRAPEDLSVIAIRRTGSGLSPWTLNVRRESLQN